jgi:Arc/MetJ-type ribon-helix-helix transcriptional regulator
MMPETATDKETRLNVRVKGLLADHVNRLVGPLGLYDNQSEYLRDLIRQDMYKRDDDDLRREIQASYSQLSKGDFREISAQALFDDAMKELEDEGYEIKE